MNQSFCKCNYKSFNQNYELTLNSQFLIAVEDCESRILINNGKTEGADLKIDERADSDGNEEGDDVDEENVEKPKGLSEYAQRRQNNIEENKKIIANLMKKYPFRKKTQLEDSSELTQSTPIVTAEDTTGPANDTTQPANETSQPANKTVLPAFDERDLSLASAETSPCNKNPTPISSPIVSRNGAEIDASPSGGVDRPGDDDGDVMDTTTSGIQVSTPGDKIPTPISSPIVSRNGTNGTVIDASPSGGVDRPGDDDGDVMDTTTSGIQVSPSQKAPSQNDRDLPPWLNLTIGYLRGLTGDTAWQNLVSDFVAFEKQQPPIGVCSLLFSLSQADYIYIYIQNLATKRRPQEISNWIKSKKKDIVPLVKPGVFGKRFMEWWKLLQPSWRNDKDSLVRSLPQGETWDGLRKGGTAGIYTVVISLSWWIKSQFAERDPIAWKAVEDISWVIQQMMNSSTSPASKTQKRALEGMENEEQPKKK